LTQLGVFLEWQGRPAPARRAFRRAIALGRRLGLARRHATALHALGRHELSEGRLDPAADLLAESVDLHRRAGRLGPAGHAQHGLADVRLEEGRFDEATRLYHESLELCSSEGENLNSLSCLAGLAAAAVGRGDVTTAGLLWGAVEAFEEHRGALVDPGTRRRYEQQLGPLDGEAFEAAKQHGRTLSLGAAVTHALEAMSPGAS